MIFRRIVTAITVASRLPTGLSFCFGNVRPLVMASTKPSCWTASSSSLVQKIPSSLSGRSAGNRSRRTQLPMIFGKFFGGGAFDLKIDYSSLDHPGPELAKWAHEGIVPEHSEQDPELKLATFAGGCFWGLELAFQRVPGVHQTAVGYTQGREATPTYDQVCAGATGHTEAVIVYYNPEECFYDTLLDTFFDRIDPTNVNGQGRDYGRQYRTGVYCHSDEQKEIAAARFASLKGKYKKPIATELKAALPFWPAEKYHQHYLEKGGRFGEPQSAEKGATETIRCYG